MPPGYVDACMAAHSLATDIKELRELDWAQQKQEQREGVDSIDAIAAKGDWFSINIAAVLRAVKDKQWDTTREMLAKCVEWVDGAEALERKKKALPNDIDEALNKFEGTSEDKAA